MLARKPRMLVTVALANKMARIIWALLVKQENFRAPGRSRGVSLADLFKVVAKCHGSEGWYGATVGEMGPEDRECTHRALEHAFMIWFRSANSHTGPQLHRCIRGRTNDVIRLRAKSSSKTTCAWRGVHRFSTRPD